MKQTVITRKYKHAVSIDESHYGNGVREFQAFCLDCSWCSPAYNNKEDGGIRRAKSFVLDKVAQHQSED